MDLLDDAAGKDDVGDVADIARIQNNNLIPGIDAGTEGDVTVEVKSDGRQVKFVISDMGVAFDPTQTTDADTTLSAEDRPIGGLGILLVRKLMDSINYERVGGRNILTLRKTIT